MKNLTCQLLTDMSGGRTLSNIQLAKSYWWRFSAKIHQLKKYWVQFEKTKWESYIEYWKIIFIPNTINYSGDRIKLTKLTVWERFNNLFN